MSKHRFDLTVTIDCAVEGGRADPEDLSDELYEALVLAIKDLVIEGEAAHATKEDETVEWSAEVDAVELYEGA